MPDAYGHSPSWVPQLPSSSAPLYRRIAEALERDIATGRLGSGFRLPPGRVLALSLGVNASTVRKAYQLGLDKGLITGRIGRGTFVSATAGIPESVLSQVEGAGTVDMGTVRALPELTEDVAEVLREAQGLVDYDLTLRSMAPEGHAKHRFMAARWLGAEGVAVEADDVIITAGAQNALAVVLVAAFTRGQRLLVSRHTYPGFKGLARALGLQLVPLDADWADETALADEITAQCAHGQVRGLYLTPDGHNPTGASLSPPQRRAVADAVRAHDLLLIEDGTFAHTLTPRPPPICAQLPDHGLWIRGLSKSFSPALRTAFLVTPRPLRDAARAAMNHLSWMASPLSVELQLLAFRTGGYARVLARHRAILEARNLAFERVFGGHRAPTSIPMFRFVPLDSEVTADAVERACFARGVQVFSSARFRVGGDVGAGGVRVALSGPRDDAELERGLDVLAACIAENAPASNPPPEVC